jgi:hypothetical protein
MAWTKVCRLSAAMRFQNRKPHLIPPRRRGKRLLESGNTHPREPAGKRPRMNRPEQKIE